MRKVMCKEENYKLRENHQITNKIIVFQENIDPKSAILQSKALKPNVIGHDDDHVGLLARMQTSAV